MTSPAPDVLRYSAFTDGGTGGNPAGVALDALRWTRADLGDGAPARFTILQGHHMDRPSRLDVDLSSGTATGTVDVSGTATDMSAAPGARG